MNSARDDAIVVIEVEEGSHRSMVEEHVLTAAGERFERGLGDEIGAFHAEVAKEFAAVRVDLAATRLSFVKWSVLLCVGLVAAISGIMALLLRAIVPR